jgi:tRNA-specific adenosine deaminase 1
MELTMAAQDDATPWVVPPPLEMAPDFFLASPQNPSKPLLGRAYFSALGIVRRKPSRPDAPTTISKSCSDKLSLKQCTSLLSSTASLLISPENAYLHTLVLPQSQYSTRACDRTFGDGNSDDGAKTTGRMKYAIGMRSEETGYRFEPFEILTTDKEFAFSRRRGSPPDQKLVPSSHSTTWTATLPSASASSGIEESLIGGVLQGRRAFPPFPSQALDLRGISLLSRKKTWRLAATIAIALLPSPPSLSYSASPTAQEPGPNPRLEPAIAIAIARALGVPGVVGTGVYLYREVKESELLSGRRHVKEVIRQTCLTGWVRNDSRGEEFTLDS